MKTFYQFFRHSRSARLRLRVHHSHKCRRPTTRATRPRAPRPGVRRDQDLIDRNRQHRPRVRAAVLQHYRQLQLGLRRRFGISQHDGKLQHRGRILGALSGIRPAWKIPLLDTRRLTPTGPVSILPWGFSRSMKTTPASTTLPWDGMRAVTWSSAVTILKSAMRETPRALIAIRSNSARKVEITATYIAGIVNGTSVSGPYVVIDTTTGQLGVSPTPPATAKTAYTPRVLKGDAAAGCGNS